jgi:hypothetical protein
MRFVLMVEGLIMLTSVVGLIACWKHSAASSSLFQSQRLLSFGALKPCIGLDCHAPLCDWGISSLGLGGLSICNRALLLAIGAVLLLVVLCQHAGIDFWNHFDRAGVYGCSGLDLTSLLQRQ